MHKTLFFLLLLCSFTSEAQLEVSYHFNAEIDVVQFEIEGTTKITVVNKGKEAIEEIPIEIWANAYQKKGTFLSNELLEDQSTALRFATPDQLGQLKMIDVKTSLDSNKNIKRKVNLTAEHRTLHLPESLNPGGEVDVFISFKYKLPSASFNGFGYDPFSIRLSNWLPMVSYYQEGAFHPTSNNRQRVRAYNSASFGGTITLHSEASIVSNLHYQSPNNEANTYVFEKQQSNDIILLIYPEHYTFSIPKSHTPQTHVKINFSEALPQIDFSKGFQQIASFLKSELGFVPDSLIQLNYLRSRQSMYGSGSFLILDYQNSKEDYEAQIVEEMIKLHLMEQTNLNSVEAPWMVFGLAHYYKTLYLRKFYPEKKYLGRVAQSFVGKLFEADEYPYEYRNIFLYHFMARQGLDQPMGDSIFAYPKLNYQAILQGKTALSFDYLRLYVGEKNFKRSMQRFLSEYNQSATPENLIKSFQYFDRNDLSWFLGDLNTSRKKYNYKLKKTEKCSYVYTATVKNRGGVNTPYSITGIKDNKPVLTEWYDGHEKKKTIQIHLEDYDRIELNHTGRFPEFYQKDNSLKTTGILKRAKPLRLQFYTSFENPKKSQLFWLPNLKYNAYDQFLIGFQLYNTTLVHKPFEYRISPDYSTGTGKVVGSASLKYNWTPEKSAFHLIDAALYGRYYHYDQGLAYTRFSPTINFNFRKKSPRSNILQKIRLRSVLLDRETPPELDDTQNTLDYSSYQIGNLRYIREDVHVLRPNLLKVDLQYAEAFSKIQVDFVQRYRLSKNHTLGLRLFAGTFLHNKYNQQQTYYSFGASGTLDYLFDYYLLGRSDETGIWSQQFFVSDGGFKSETGLFSSNTMLSLNAQIPLWRFLKIFGDIGYLSEKNQPIWDYGLAIIIVPDFVEIYFPIQSSETFFLDHPAYETQIRYVLNLDFSEIINRLRRGYY